MCRGMPPMSAHESFMDTEPRQQRQLEVPRKSSDQTGEERNDTSLRHGETREGGSKKHAPKAVHKASKMSCDEVDQITARKSDLPSIQLQNARWSLPSRSGGLQGAHRSRCSQTSAYLTLKTRKSVLKRKLLSTWNICRPAGEAGAENQLET